MIDQQSPFTNSTQITKPFPKVFVLMPTGTKGEYNKGSLEADIIYTKIIREAVRTVFGSSESVFREIDKNYSGSITNDIIKEIDDSDICIVDITGLNPNVMFELGIRYARKMSTTILICQDDTKIPFDFQNQRVLFYTPLVPEQAVARIADALVNFNSKKKSSTDSPVFEALGLKSEDLNGMLPQTMNWADLSERIEFIIRKLRDRPQYQPDIVFGITNGGMIIAEWIHHRVYRLASSGLSTPLLSLWARRDKSLELPDMLDNEFNNGLLKQIRSSKEFSEKQLIKILLIDDNVNSGTSARQAITLIKKVLLEKADIAYLPLVVRRSRLKILDGFSELLWKRKDFEDPEFDYYNFHATDDLHLPYAKELLTY